MFDGDIETVYKRFIIRDKSPERHRGHVVNSEYPEKEPKEPYVEMGLDKFIEKAETRGFRTFDIGGPVIKVNTTDFDKVDREEINKKIDEEIRKII